MVSLSSVKRTLKRHGLLKSRSPWQKTCKSPHRPIAASPGDLVQMDTIHIYTIAGQRFYVYTLLDVHSREVKIDRVCRFRGVSVSTRNTC